MTLMDPYNNIAPSAIVVDANVKAIRGHEPIYSRSSSLTQTQLILY